MTCLTYLAGLLSDLQVGKHSTRQSWLGSKKYAICKRKQHSDEHVAWFCQALQVKTDMIYIDA